MHDREYDHRVWSGDIEDPVRLDDQFAHRRPLGARNRFPHSGMLTKEVQARVDFAEDALRVTLGALPDVRDDAREVIDRTLGPPEQEHYAGRLICARTRANAVS